MHVVRNILCEPHTCSRDLESQRPRMDSIPSVDLWRCRRQRDVPPPTKPTPSRRRRKELRPRKVTVDSLLASSGNHVTVHSGRADVTTIDQAQRITLSITLYRTAHSPTQGETSGRAISLGSVVDPRRPWPQDAQTRRKRSGTVGLESMGGDRPVNPVWRQSY